MDVRSVFVDTILTPQFVLTFLLALLLVHYIRKRRYNLPPRPHSWPIVGNMFAYDLKTFHLWCQEVTKTHGPVFRVSIGHSDAVVINDIRHAQMALVKTAAEFAGRPESVVFDEGSEHYQDVAFADPTLSTWPQMRKLFAISVRNFTNGRAYEQRTAETFRQLQSLLDEKCDSGEAFGTKNICKLFTYNQFAGLCFSTSYRIDDEEFLMLIKDFDYVNGLVGELQMSDLLPFLNYLPFPMPGRLKIRRAVANIFNFINREIEKHKKTFTGEETSDLTYYVLKMMAEDESYAQITDVQQRQIISDVFGAGVDTSQITLRWIIIFLAAFPDQQEKIYDEILQAIGPIDKADPECCVSSIDYRSKMPYSEAFLLEATRYGTVVPMGLPRKTMCDTKIGEWDVPKGTTVFANQYAINFDENENEDAHKFRPGRFLDKDGLLGKRPNSYMSFGLGRRACPGETAARNTLWMAMIMLLRRYEVLPPEGVELVPQYAALVFVGEPKDYEIRLKYREKTEGPVVC